MIYRLDDLSENRINPVTGGEYDDSWLIYMLSDSGDYRQMCGSNNGCAYTVKVSRTQERDWRISAGDFIGFCNANGKNAILVMSEDEFESVNAAYSGHAYNEPFLRENEPAVLIHSTSMENWRKIERAGKLKNWNQLKAENAVTERQPIGRI